MGFLFEPTVAPSLREPTYYVPFIGELCCALTSLPMIYASTVYAGADNDLPAISVFIMGVCSFISHAYPIKIFHIIDLTAIAFLVSVMLFNYDVLDQELAIVIICSLLSGLSDKYQANVNAQHGPTIYTAFLHCWWHLAVYLMLYVYLDKVYKKSMGFAKYGSI